MAKSSTQVNRSATVVLQPFLFLLLLLAFVSITEWIVSHWIPRAFSPMAPAFLRFTDWTNFLRRSREFGHPGMLTRNDLGFPFPYPLPSIYTFLPFALLGSHPVVLYVVVCAAISLAIVGSFAYGIWQRTHSGNLQVVVWGTALLFHPLWFLIDRGNIEIFLWLLLAAGTFLFVKQKPVAAGVLFGIAGSMKIYPAIFLLLFVKRRNYGALLVSAAILLAVTLGTYWIAGPTILGAMHDMQHTAKELNDAQIAVVNVFQVRWDHSVFALVKQAAYTYRHVRFGTPEAAMSFGPLTRLYGILAMLAFCGCFVFRLRFMPLLNQFGGLLLFALLLPFVSYDYTLVHLSLLYGCLMLSSLEGFNGKHPLLAGKRGMATAALLAIAFSPLTNLALRRFGGQGKCLALLGLLYLLLRHPVPSLLFGDAGVTDRAEAGPVMAEA